MRARSKFQILVLAIALLSPQTGWADEAEPVEMETLEQAQHLHTCTVYNDEVEDGPARKFLVCTLKSGNVELSALIEGYECTLKEGTHQCIKVDPDNEDRFGPYQAEGTHPAIQASLLTALAHTGKREPKGVPCTVYADAAYKNSPSRYLVCFKASSALELSSVIHYQFCEIEGRRKLCRPIGPEDTHGSIGPFRAVKTLTVHFEQDLSNIFEDTPALSGAK